MSVKKDGAVGVGVGVAACAACCAGPILGFFALIGLGTLTGVLLFGIAGFFIALMGVAVFIARRRRRLTACRPGPEVVPVGVPTIRTR